MPADEMRIDDLARAAGVATTTVRLYQAKGLLPGPRLVGRTGWYGEEHLARLRLISRLQDQGFSLAGIGHLVETWEQGRDLADLVGVEGQLDALLGPSDPVVLNTEDLLARFPEGAEAAELFPRAIELGLLEDNGDGRWRVPDRRFVDTGTALARLGVPLATVIDEWAALRRATDAMAERFVAVFETHVAGGDQRPEELAVSLGELRRIAGDVVAAALDASLAAEAGRRLGDLIPEPPPGGQVPL
jgi:DNA-binding transcriptional MerR regulator